MTPLLPCPDIDDAVSFYAALGFERTYRQVRPNPYAVVEREGIGIHLFGIDGFDPEASYGSVIIEVTDPDAMFQSFAAGLRSSYGKLPTAGIPRILRPRKRQGTVYGFTVVDLGGNWLRVSRLGDTEEDAALEDTSTGLARVISNAARLGDAHGDEDAAIRLIGNGLVKYPDAPAIDRVRAMLYRVELACRIPDADLAGASLAEARGIELEEDAALSVAADFAHASHLVDDL